VISILKKGDLLLFESINSNASFNLPAIGVVLERWGTNSHNEKMYKIFTNGAVEVISEIEVKEVLSTVSKKKHY